MKTGQASMMSKKTEIEYVLGCQGFYCYEIVPDNMQEMWVNISKQTLLSKGV